METAAKVFFCSTVIANLAWIALKVCVTKHGQAQTQAGNTEQPGTTIQDARED